MNGKTAAIGIAIAAIVLVFLYVYTMHSAPAPPLYANSSQGTEINGQVFVNYMQQLNVSKSLGYNFTTASFYCGQTSDCQLVQLAPCDNNIPSQFGCINPSAYASYAAHKAEISKDAVCPFFMEKGSASCVCASSFCEEVFKP